MEEIFVFFFCKMKGNYNKYILFYPYHSLTPLYMQSLMLTYCSIHFKFHTFKYICISERNEMIGEMEFNGACKSYNRKVMDLLKETAC